jgi:hypothetical protein
MEHSTPEAYSLMECSTRAVYKPMEHSTPEGYSPMEHSTPEAYSPTEHSTPEGYSSTDLPLRGVYTPPDSRLQRSSPPAPRILYRRPCLQPAVCRTSCKSLSCCSLFLRGFVQSPPSRERRAAQLMDRHPASHGAGPHPSCEAAKPSCCRRCFSRYRPRSAPRTTCPGKPSPSAGSTRRRRPVSPAVKSSTTARTARSCIHPGKRRSG